MDTSTHIHSDVLQVNINTPQQPTYPPTHAHTHIHTHTHTQHRQTNTHRHSTHTIAHETRKVQMRTMASQRCGQRSVNIHTYPSLKPVQRVQTSPHPTPLPHISSAHPTKLTEHTPPLWTSSPTVVGLNTVHIKVHTYVHLHTPGLPCACTDTGCALFDTQVTSHWSKNQYHIISLCNLPYSNSTVLFCMFCEDS